MDPAPPPWISQLPRAQTPPPQKRRRFRWWLILGPAWVLLAVGLWRSVEPWEHWELQMARWGIAYHDRFTTLVVLAIVLLALLFVARVWRKHGKGED
jgi:hypothetical protein